jgi:hypothetical protein
VGASNVNYSGSNNYSILANPTWINTLDGNPAYVEWNSGESGVTKTLADESAIDVSTHDTVWVVITSYAEYSTAGSTDSSTQSVDDIVLTNIENLNILNRDRTTSTTWNNYKSTNPSENNNDDYEDDTYWPIDGNRYGLDPQHSQINGSFYIDCDTGKIHFSSNLSGKTIVLNYISDSLGTDAEMQVHKFAEEAMYKCIAYSILSTRANIPEVIVRRYKKERFAAVRQAKLRLSNIKLEEITQVLRGKSKHIKH